MSRGLRTPITLSIVGLFSLATTLAQGPTSTAITYQGQLTQGGEPVSGAADFLVGIYDVETGGSAQDTLTFLSVPVDAGLFMLDLNFDPSTYNGDGLWLDIQVAVPPGGPLVTLTPRQPIRAAPYALYALDGGGGSLWTANGSNIYYVDGDVGIGTTDPERPLVVEVHYSNNINPMATFRATGTNAAGAIRFENGVGDTFNFGITGDGDLALGHNANIGLPGDVLRVTPAGNVGIGAVAPTSLLTVDGLVESRTDGFKFPDGTVQMSAATGGGSSLWSQNGADIYYNDGNVGIGATDPAYRLQVYAGADAAIAGENPSENTRGELGSTYGGVFGESTTGDGVFGQVTDASAINSGVRGESPSPAGFGVQGLALAYSGTSTGVYGWARSPNGRGVYGLVEGDFGRGVFGEVTGTNGYGVMGKATTGTGVYGESIGNHGVSGSSESSTSAGVFGYNDAGSGDAVGVSGFTASSNGRAVYGTSAGTYARGVMGEVTGSNGYGVYGQAAGGTGVYGEATNGDGVSGYAMDPDKAGVKGENEAGTGSSIGVRGITGSSGGYGVYGSGAGNYARGVFGEVTGSFGYGVFGQAAGGTGIYGESDGGDGISGYAHDPAKAGVKGENEASTGSSIGVRGITGSSGGYGVFGSGAGNSARGVFGEVTGSSGYGVFGQATGGTGVYGESDAGNGVSGYAHDAAKAGVKGENEASTGSAIGVWGISGSSAGFGGYFEGRGYFSNMVGIGTASPDEMLHVDGRVKIENSVVGDALLINTPGDGIYVDANGGAFDCYGAAFGVRGYSNTGIGVHASGSGTSTASPALFVENTNSGGIATYSTSTSNDTNTLIVNKGTGDLIKGFSGATGNDLVFKVTNDGTTHTNVLQINGGSDLAEKFDISETAEAGTVVAIDPDHPGKLCVARGAYNRCVAGVISGANGVDTGMVLADLPGANNSLPVALSGRVWVRCDATSTAIEPGDLLTTAERPGHAMAVGDFDRAHGAVIGKAMTRLAEGETGMVLVLVNLQ